MSATQVTRGSRRFVLAGLGFLLCWQAAAVAGAGRRTYVVLGLYGFVLHTVFGKAYALVPSYFDRALVPARAPAAQLPLSVVGVGCLAASGVGPAWLRPVGAVLWASGVTVFLATLAWTVRGNPTGAETATSDAKADRRPVDRVANAAVPVVGLYLGAGTGLLALDAVGGTTLGSARASHLLAAGGAALLLFAVGFRLLPRFLGGHPHRTTVSGVLLAGAVGPALLAVGLPAGQLLIAGAGVEATAVVGFAGSYLRLFARSSRRRVGLYAVAVAVVAGTAGVALGVAVAVAGYDATLVGAHYRLNLLGFLGLSIVGVTLQFYPPSVGRHRFADGRTAAVSIGLVASGLAVQALGLVAAVAGAVTVGETATLLGVVIHAWLVATAHRARAG